MKLTVQHLSREEWSELSENAHLVAFGEVRPAEKERVDFAVIVHDEHNCPLGYITVKELDAETIYWQFGGAMPEYKGTNLIYKGYELVAASCQEKYKRVLTYIENNNITMLKFAMKLGFRIIGMKIHGSRILLEHMLEF